MKSKNNLILFAVALLVSFQASAALRIVSYNTAQGVRSGMSTIMDYIGSVDRNGVVRPVDILLLQEQLYMTTTTQDIVDVMNALYGTGVYARGTLNGSTTGAGRPGIVYNTTTVDLLDEEAVNSTSSSGAARATIRYTLRPVGYTSDDAIFYAYVSHFKASTDSEARRAVEASEIRDDSDALGDAHIIYAGDLNLYSSSEQAWQNLTASGDGQAFDPVSRVGSWHDSSSFSDVHTQSPATSSQFSGQVTGGMDDRFDFQLITAEFQDGEGLSYIPESYYTVGNNDTHTLNGAITTGSDATATVRNALASTSDHLPVMADYQVPAVMQAAVSAVPEPVQINDSASLLLSISNAADVSAAVGADELEYTIAVSGDLSLSGDSGGTVEALAQAAVHTLELDTTSMGTKSGQVTVTSSSQAVENSEYVFNIEYEVEDNNAIVTDIFDWNAFYRHDPNAVLDVDSGIAYEVQILDEAAPHRILSAYNDGGSAGWIYLALLDQLVDGDEIQIEGQVRSNDGGDVSLGCAYVADAGMPYSVIDDLGSPSAAAGADWTTLQQTFAYDASIGSCPVVLYARLSAGSVCDVNEISITAKAHTTIQWPLATTEIDCVETPEMDFDGDCKVNMNDFQYLAEVWMDGQVSETSGNLDTVMITGILDGTISTGYPKVIELYVSGTHDLSEYSLSRALSGADWDDGVTLSGTYSDTFVYLICSYSSGVSVFNDVFGQDGAFANHALEDGQVYLDGNDGFRLLKDDQVIDQVYDSTSTYGYRDTYLYRLDSTGPDGDTWVEDNWTSPGMNFLDSFSTAETLGDQVPFGTYKYDATCTNYPEYDFSQDCQINLPDLVIFWADWMECHCSPAWGCLE